jgi:hypothetical protein
MAFIIDDIIAGNAAKKNEKKQINQKYQIDTEQYNFAWEEQLRNYNFTLGQTQQNRANEAKLAKYQDATAVSKYTNDLKIREYEYGNALKQFNESERIFNKQIEFNQQAAQRAMTSENQKLQETFMSSAFEHQDMLVQMMQEEGMMQARGVSGKSAGKLLQGALAQFGRNQAVMAESLVSADRSNRRALDKIGIDQYQANISAEANRMLPPSIAPAPVKPLATPRSVLLDPRKPVKGPPPRKGIPTITNAGIVAGAIGSGVSTGLSIAGLFKG